MKKMLYLTLFLAQVAYADPAYQVVDLGEMDAVPVALNDNGGAIAYEVSTDALGRTVKKPIAWDGVSWREIGAKTDESFHPQAMNGSGQVVGEYYGSDGNRYGWAWDKRVGLREADRQHRSSYADINDRGDIAETAEDDQGVRNPYVLLNGQMTRVFSGQPEASLDGFAARINTSGEVAGVIDEKSHASFYVAAPGAGGYQVKKLSAVFGEGGFATVAGLNSQGVALLNETLCAEEDPCCEQGHGYRVWDSRTGKVLLSRFNKEFGNVGTATAINDHGTVVGIGLDSSSWIWDKAYGDTPVLISSLIDATRWNVLEPRSINGKGEILATALYAADNKRHVVILQPMK